ncbi:MAG: nucleotide exchange factor GrpE [Mycoplasma sp.]|nr:nucleotide exchange factor GrpE [Mycoplasma sp.]
MKKDQQKNSDKIKKTEVNELESLKQKNQELKKQFDELVKSSNDLKLQLENRNKYINELNKDFVNIINQKALTAQKQLDIEIKKMQDKFEKDFAEKKKYALSDSLSELLGIISKFDLALNQQNNDPKVNNFLTGLKMFSTMFKSWLKSIGVEEINVKVGDKFDPNIMDAIIIESNPKQKNDHVEKVISKGYKLHDRIIQHTHVVVAKTDQVN